MAPYSSFRITNPGVQESRKTGAEWNSGCVAAEINMNQSVRGWSQKGKIISIVNVTSVRKTSQGTEQIEH
jgi:hypothetical protein